MTRLPRLPPPPLRRRRGGLRGGILGYLLGGLVVLACAGVLAWMALLPSVLQTRFRSATGARLDLEGLMGDPFAGRAVVKGWSLHREGKTEGPALATGGASALTTPDWRIALGSKGQFGPISIHTLDLHVNEVQLIPDPQGEWPLVALVATLGLPYEKPARPGLRIRKLHLGIDKAGLLDPRTGSTLTVDLAWQAEFRDLDHSRPILVALLAALRATGAAPALPPAP